MLFKKLVVLGATVASVTNSSEADASLNRLGNAQVAEVPSTAFGSHRNRQTNNGPKPTCSLDETCETDDECMTCANCLLNKESDTKHCFPTENEGCGSLVNWGNFRDGDGNLLWSKCAEWIKASDLTDDTAPVMNDDLNFAPLCGKLESENEPDRVVECTTKANIKRGNSGALTRYPCREGGNNASTEEGSGPICGKYHETNRWFCIPLKNATPWTSNDKLYKQQKWATGCADIAPPADLAGAWENEN
jgi:hypothetical protein